MKKSILIIVSVLVVFMVAACTSPPKEVKVESDTAVENTVPQELINEDEVVINSRYIPSVTIDPKTILIDRRQQIVISGAGFPPEREVLLHTLDPDNVLSSLTFLWGSPQTDEFGSFSVSAPLDRMASIMKPGVYPLWVIVEDTEVVVPLVYVKKD